MLYIVSTPIGNLKDISLRALETLKSVALIACEDTRHSKILLDHYAIKTPTTSFFQHNRITKAAYIVRLLKEGKDVALISDAGTPGILDPGYNLINSVLKEGIPLTCIPGPVAFINSLVLSGKPAHEFIFAGFLPNRSIARKNRLKKLAEAKSTIIFYESCHRIVSCLEDVQDALGDREIVVTRELTKKFEEVRRDKTSSIITHFKEVKPKGEFVVVI